MERDLRVARSARWYDPGVRHLERKPERPRRPQVLLGLASAGVETEARTGVAMPIIAPDKNTVCLIDWQHNDLYRFFAFVFAPPTREHFELLSEPSLPEALRNLWKQLGCKGEFPGFE